MSEEYYQENHDDYKTTVHYIDGAPGLTGPAGIAGPESESGLIQIGYIGTTLTLDTLVGEEYSPIIKYSRERNICKCDIKYHEDMIKNPKNYVDYDYAYYQCYYQLSYTVTGILPITLTLSFPESPSHPYANPYQYIINNTSGIISGYLLSYTEYIYPAPPLTLSISQSAPNPVSMGIEGWYTIWLAVPLC